MRYFTYELFLAQSDESMSLIEEEQIQEQWNKNVLEYRTSYKSIANKVSNDVYQHFNGWGFHDYHLLSFELEHESLRKMSLKLTLSNDEGLSAKELRFSDVSSFEYHHKNYSNEKSMMNRDIDIWLYEEFLSVDSVTLSFEVMFSSGASIALKFPNHAVTIIKER
ncbi:MULTISPECIES: hypothetical protein [Bacillaceae]|uniref:hypothetical protein n=1 Tax=Bacillaceae TaxID=186817 RepID=UPI0001E8929B|nr:hypothetical protein [Bacillus sp. m3-13]